MSNNIEAVPRRLLATAGISLIVIGTGHFLTLVALRSAIVGGWFNDGFWAAVPFLSRTPSLDSLASSATFWASIGGFAIPVVLLGALIVHLGRLGIAVPAWLGWIVGVWGLVTGSLLNAPTPFYALPIVGALIVVAHRASSKQAAAGAAR